MTLEDLIDAVEVIDAWLDSAASPEYKTQPLAQDYARVTKACEESGEVWKAWSKYTGENPRKRGTEQAALDDVLEELGDTVTAGLCGIQHLTKDKQATRAILIAAVAKARSRVPGGPRNG
jgi:NTP pyrophosphatase (non-canonical NTP hydrolase)